MSLIPWLKRILRIPKPELLVVGLVHQHQWLDGENSTPLELEQRRKFITRMKELVERFRPTLVLDEIPDTDNKSLIAILPHQPIPIDIPSETKLQKGFNIARARDLLCPYIDSIRERFWLHRIYRETKSLWQPRVLIFVGATHLKSFFYKDLSFPELLRRAGYRVETVDLFNGDWDHSWIWDWKHPIAPVNWEHGSRCCIASGSFQNNDNHCERKVYWKERLATKPK